MTKTIDVEIYGQLYAIRGEADEGDVRRLASFVDGQMRHLAERPASKLSLERWNSMKPTSATLG